MRLTLELTPNREPIEGALRNGPGEALAFTGWIEPVAELESVLEAGEARHRDAGAKQDVKEE